MKPETQGKLMVGMVISILAFGLGTATILVTGNLPTLNTTTTLNNTTNSDFPIVSNNDQNIENTSTSQNSQQDTQDSNNNNNNNPSNNSYSNTTNI